MCAHSGRRKARGSRAARCPANTGDTERKVGKCAARSAQTIAAECTEPGTATGGPKERSARRLASCSATSALADLGHEEYRWDQSDSPTSNLVLMFTPTLRRHGGS